MTTDDLQGIAKVVCGLEGLDFVQQVGEGAFKQTFQVTDSDGNSLALKVYKPGSHQARNEREIAAMRLCNHPNIARLYSASTISVDGTEYPYSTEEFLPGGTLTSLLRSDGPLTVRAVLVIGEQLIGALTHIREHNLVHRDLKPDNIMLREDRLTPVIVDFGIVRVLDAASITGTWQNRGPGTPYFAAPEQLNNEKELIDWRTDQFSLGIVLSRCVYDTHPYDKGDVGLTISAVAQRDGPSEAFKDMVVALRLPALRKMVAPWPAGRFRTPDALAIAWAQQGV